MKKTIKIGGVEKEFECCLDTFRIYENQFNRRLLKDFDKANKPIRTDNQDYEDVDKIYIMADILWALAHTANSEEKLTIWQKYDPGEIIIAYNEVIDLVINSLSTSRKNV